MLRPSPPPIDILKSVPVARASSLSRCGGQMGQKCRVPEFGTSSENNPRQGEPSSQDAMAGTRAQVANTLRGYRREGATIRLEATPLGGGRANVLIARLDPTERLLLDTVSLASAK